MNYRKLHRLWRCSLVCVAVSALLAWAVGAAGPPGHTAAPGEPRPLPARPDADLIRAVLAEALHAASDADREDRGLVRRQIAETTARAGRIDDAIRIAEDTPGEEGERAKKDIVTLLAARGRLSDAEAIARQVTGTYERAIAFDAIGRSEAKAGRRADALKHLALAEGIAAQIPSDPILLFLSRDTALGLIATNKALAGDVAGAFATAAKATGRGRHEAIYGVASGRLQAGDYEQAVAIAKKAEADGDLAPSTATHILCLVASAEAKSGRTETSRKTFREATRRALADAGARAGILAEIGWRQGAAGFAADARATLDQASAAASSVKDEDRRNDVRIVIAIELATAGFSDEALAAIDAIHFGRPSRKSGALGAIARTHAAAGRFGDAREAIRRIPDSESLDRFPLFEVLAAGQAVKGLLADARATAAEALGAARAVKDAHRRDVALEAAAVAFAEAREYDKALSVAHSISAGRETARALCDISARMLKQLEGTNVPPSSRKRTTGGQGK